MGNTLYSAETPVIPVTLAASQVADVGVGVGVDVCSSPIDSPPVMVQATDGVKTTETIVMEPEPKVEVSVKHIKVYQVEEYICEHKTTEGRIIVASTPGQPCLFANDVDIYWSKSVNGTESGGRCGRILTVREKAVKDLTASDVIEVQCTSVVYCNMHI